MFIGPPGDVALKPCSEPVREPVRQTLSPGVGSVNNQLVFLIDPRWRAQVVDAGAGADGERSGEEATVEQTSRSRWTRAEANS
jgi:hypothetical protein